MYLIREPFHQYFPSLEQKEGGVGTQLDQTFALGDGLTSTRHEFELLPRAQLARQRRDEHKDAPLCPARREHEQVQHIDDLLYLETLDFPTAT